MRRKVDTGKLKKVFGKKRFNNLKNNILKENKAFNVLITNKKEAYVLIDILHDLGLKWEDGTEYKYKYNTNGQLIRHTKLSLNKGYLSKLDPRYYYPLLGKIAKIRLKNTGSHTIEFKDFIKLTHKYLTLNNLNK